MTGAHGSPVSRPESSLPTHRQWARKHLPLWLRRAFVAVCNALLLRRSGHHHHAGRAAK